MSNKEHKNTFTFLGTFVHNGPCMAKEKTGMVRIHYPVSVLERLAALEKATGLKYRDLAPTLAAALCDCFDREQELSLPLVILSRRKHLAAAKTVRQNS